MKEILKKYLLKKYTIVSFDIFDTLLERKVDTPTDIFKLTGLEILKLERAEKFLNDRKTAERIARNKALSGEVTLQNIYHELEGYSVEEKKKLMEEEINQEIKLCYPKESILEFYSKVIKSHKTVYLISDMYLSRDVIQKMLEKCGIANYEKLFISNEYGVNKLTGKLFTVVLEKEKIEKKNMIHIGDSIKADFLGARKAGMKSILIGRKNRLGRLIKR